MAITLATGNPNKLAELREMFPADIELRHAKLDIAEIQGENADPYEIVEDKLMKAYKLVNGPVIVEDVSAELDCLGGLPGPFVKFFEKKLGRGALWTLVRYEENKRATIRCIMGYYDGKVKKIVEGTVRGQIVSPRGENGFGFDFVFMPDGHSRTTSQMTRQEKRQISWRGLAARALAAEIFQR